jgi:hypothetical protein
VIKRLKLEGSDCVLKNVRPRRSGTANEREVQLTISRHHNPLLVWQSGVSNSSFFIDGTTS